jgi:cob(I)alamin adenosyltransferase
MEDDQFYTGDNGEVWVVKNIPKGHDIMEYLPDVEEIISTVKQFDEQSEQFDCSCRRSNYDLPCQLH